MVCFVFGSPVINGATLTLPNEKIFHMTIKNNSNENKYIQNITFNGKQYSKSYILYRDIMNGGDINIEMGNQPSKTWGVDPGDRPYSGLKD